MSNLAHEYTEHQFAKDPKQAVRAEKEAKHLRKKAKRSKLTSKDKQRLKRLAGDGQ